MLLLVHHARCTIFSQLQKFSRRRPPQPQHLANTFGKVTLRHCRKKATFATQSTRGWSLPRSRLSFCSHSLVAGSSVTGAVSPFTFAVIWRWQCRIGLHREWELFPGRDVSWYCRRNKLEPESRKKWLTCEEAVSTGVKGESWFTYIFRWVNADACLTFASPLWCWERYPVSVFVYPFVVALSLYR